MKQVNDKIQLPRKEILNRYFVAYEPYWDTICTNYYQISADSSISEIDSSELVNCSGCINMFLGANCSNSDNLHFHDVIFLFLSGRNYSSENLKKLNIGFNFDKVPNIDLSNNDFSEYTFIWDFSNFLNEIFSNVSSYVYPAFSQEFKEAKEEDEVEYNTCGIFYGEAYRDVYIRMEEIIKPIVMKLIPNIQNTNIKILIDFRRSSLNSIIEEVLKRGFFDGCYIKAVNCPTEISEKMKLSKNDFELYQYPQNVYIKIKNN